MDKTGWIKLHRTLLDWDWADDPKVFALFVTCLLKANHEPNTWRGIDIQRGQFITSLDSLKAQTGLTHRELRTALKKLQKTGEIDKQTTSQNTRITVIEYDKYQERDKPKTNERQTKDKGKTTNKNEKNDNNSKKGEGTHLDAQELGQFQNVWMDYLQHRTELNCNGYKSHNSEKIKFNQLIKLSGNKPRMAQGIVNQSRANNWQGLFELKDETYLPEADQKEKPLPKVKDI